MAVRWREACTGCECQLDQYTDGCRTCNGRRWWRNKKAGITYQRPPLSTKYHATHTRLRRTRGDASAHQCVRCLARAEEWAQIHTEDGQDIWSDYVTLCKSCHRAYDGRGHEVPAVTREKMSQFTRSRQRAGGRWV